MTKEQIIQLLNTKIKLAKDEVIIFNHSQEYFAGVINGMKQAKELIAMIDNENNHDTKKNEETSENFLRMC